ncbi:hypothetical protein B7P43_G12867 [Cryptotermes secundus]|uniref:Endonuclease/exonuclease/phosphatase domain-containing protein n=1 Tax=Cryptotermes secundus TaxID=105785 RepID=A0A2J7QP97_9NEOP|nr:hypothetical protein B7P43_G12867 [Cryptotermes secundus]
MIRSRRMRWVGHVARETHNQIDHILIERRRHSCILDVRAFRAADCNTDHYLVVAKVRERLAVSKQTRYRVHTERFNLKKLNAGEGKGQYRVKISNRFSALENLDAEVDTNKARETIRENMKRSPKENPGLFGSKKLSHGSTNDAQKYYLKENKPNCRGYRIQAKYKGVI